jgi:LacI family transcriptional regulator
MTTLKELAKLLNISVSTVSKALNDSHEISANTKKRVNELAEMLGGKSLSASAVAHAKELLESNH